MHPDFDHEVENTQTMVPVILSHSLHSNRRLHLNTVSELAANGCIVYCINHTDGSSLSYQNKDEKALVVYEHSEISKEKAKTMNTHRVRELGELIETIKEEAKIFRIDLSKLTALGIELGGTTVVELSNDNLDKIKYCISINPSLNLISSPQNPTPFTIPQPFLTISTAVTSEEESMLDKFIDDSMRSTNSAKSR